MLAVYLLSLNNFPVNSGKDHLEHYNHYQDYHIKLVNHQALADSHHSHLLLYHNLQQVPHNH